MRLYILLAISAAVLVLAAVASRFSDLTGEPAEPAPAIDDRQATVDRILERTLRESRTGVETPAIETAPVVEPPPESVVPVQTAATEPGAGVAQLPEGYSLGTYRGPMQRAPLTGAPDPEPAPNPDWLGSGSAHDAILDQADRSGRAFTFAVLRVLPGTDLLALDRSLAALGTAVEGSAGGYVRIRVPAERGRLESIAGLPGVLGVGALPPEIKADEAFVQEMRSRAAGEQAPVYITLMAPDPAGEWRRALSGLGAVVGAYDSDLRSYTANLPASALAEVVRADYVMYVEPVPVVTANHDSAMPVMGVDGVRNYDSATDRFTGVTGSGIAVGVLDTGLNVGHMDIAYGRGSICGANFVPDETWDLWVDLHGHGTHVFGTIAGAGRTDRVLAGAAPNLSHLRFGKVLSSRGSGSGDDIRRGMDYFAHPSSCMWQGEQAEAVKPLIVNMSLSATSLTFSGRGVGERKLDSVVHAYSQLYVVAQANSSLHGFSNYGTAKNSLSVGAVEDTGIIARFSSHGPT
ncbi:MAG: S8 family serine peptidase, partial [Chloroflexi bacterium]|nr:S8 family serine peptidase [Chloroflexota bacterium]